MSVTPLIGWRRTPGVYKWLYTRATGKRSGCRAHMINTGGGGVTRSADNVTWALLVGTPDAHAPAATRGYYRCRVRVTPAVDGVNAGSATELLRWIGLGV